MPPEYLTLFLDNEHVPEPDDVLGEQEVAEAVALPTADELRRDPAVQTVLAAVERLASAHTPARVLAAPPVVR